MNSKVQRIITEYQSALVRLTGFIVTSMIFLSGIGRYRVVALYAAYSLLDAIFTIKKPIKQIQYIWFPAILFALYLDLTEGPFLPVFSKNYILLAAAVMIVADTLARNYVEKLFEQYSDRKLFVVCPSCNYENEELVAQCAQCEYKSGDQIQHAAINTHGNKYSIKPKVLRMLNLAEGEEILYYLSGSPALTCFIKGDRENIINFFVTDRQIIFLDYYRFNIRFDDGWRVKYSIPMSDVSRIAGKIKKISVAEMPCLEIITSAGESYELFYSNFGKKKKDIKEVANIILKANPQIEVEIDLPEGSPWQALY